MFDPQFPDALLIESHAAALAPRSGNGHVLVLLDERQLYVTTDMALTLAIELLQSVQLLDKDARTPARRGE
jgi:hypothetical protein